jgi:hypothetical protein
MSTTHSIDTFYKYKNTSTNMSLPEELTQYCITDHDELVMRKRKHSIIQMNDIKTYLNAHMSKRNNNTDDDTLYDKMQSLLNKLSSGNFNEIATEIKDLPYVKKKHIFRLCERIITKSVTEPTFSDSYAKLCQSLFPYFIRDQTEEVYFRVCLMIICQDMFEELTSKKPKLNDKYERSIDYSKLKLSGMTKFLGELYCHNVLNDKVIYPCFNSVYDYVKNGQEDYVEALLSMVNTIYHKLYVNNSELYNKIKSQAEDLLNNYKFTKSANKFKVLEILDLYKCPEN